VQACDLIGLKKGDTISLAQDDAKPECWYVYKDKAGFALQPIAKGGLTFHHQDLTDQFLGCWNYVEDKTYKTAVNPEPVTIKGDKSATQYWLVKPV